MNVKLGTCYTFEVAGPDDEPDDYAHQISWEVKDSRGEQLVPLGEGWTTEPIEFCYEALPSSEPTVSFRPTHPPTFGPTATQLPTLDFSTYPTDGQALVRLYKGESRQGSFMLTKPSPYDIQPAPP